MAKSGVIVTHPKSKHHRKPPKKDGVYTHGTTKSGRSMKRDHKSGRVMELPPGPPNYIVRTPYPLIPSKEDERSE